MNVIAVESATLAAVAYDDARGILQLEFRSRAVCKYFGVPRPVYEALLTATSMGGYFNRAIRGVFPRVRSPNPGAGPAGEV
jgi:hypothetical protein